MDLRADRAYLRRVAYGDDRLLRDRLSLYDYQRPRLDLVGRTITALGDIAGRRVADVGCGNGVYHPALQKAGAGIIAVDLSAGMLHAVPDLPAGVVGDVQALPLATASVDVALAMHMLYHVPEPAVGVAELSRILAPDGQLVAAVGGARHLAEAHELWVPLLAEVGLDASLRELGLVNNRLPAARLQEILGGRFRQVTGTTLTSQVVLDDPGPLVRHAASTAAAKVGRDLSATMIDRLNSAAAEVIRREGVVRITTEVAWFHGVGPSA